MISFGICKSIQKMSKCVEIKAFSMNLVQKRLYLHRISIKIEEAKSDKGEAGI